MATSRKTGSARRVSRRPVVLDGSFVLLMASIAAFGLFITNQGMVGLRWAAIGLALAGWMLIAGLIVRHGHRGRGG